MSHKHSPNDHYNPNPPIVFLLYEPQIPWMKVSTSAPNNRLPPFRHLLRRLTLFEYVVYQLLYTTQRRAKPHPK